MVIPKLVYKGSNLPVMLPDSFIKQVNQILFKFIWASKWEKIRRSQLCCDIEEGGVKMIDSKQHIGYWHYNLKEWSDYLITIVQLLGKRLKTCA